MGIFRAIVQPAASFLTISRTDFFQRSAIGPEAVGHEDVCANMIFHCFPEKFQRGFLVACLGDKALKHFALVIHSPPQIVPLAVDLGRVANVVEITWQPAPGS